MQLAINSTSLWSSPGVTDTVLLKDVPSVGVLMMVTTKVLSNTLTPKSPMSVYLVSVINIIFILIEPFSEPLYPVDGEMGNGGGVILAETTPIR